MAEDKNVPAAAPLGKPGGLYDSVRMSRRQANLLALAAVGLLAAVTVLVIAFGRTGFTVTFDARGGTDVESVALDYGDTLPAVADPERAGYDFIGWYKDPDCSEPWGGDDTVTENLTLYAGWENKTREAD